MYPNLKAEMARHGIRNKDIAEVLGVTPKTVSSKINCRTYFMTDEIVKIRDTFFPKISIDDLFSEETIDEAYRIPAVPLTKEEGSLLLLWRQLSHNEQLKVFGRIDLVLEQCAAEMTTMTALKERRANVLFVDFNPA